MSGVGSPEWSAHLAAARQDAPDGSESVWDYPRPPRLEPVARHLEVIFAGVAIADTTEAYRVLETSHPPNYYLPPDGIRTEFLRRTDRRSFCEWKGTAHYLDVIVGNAVAHDAAWGYDHPTMGFEAIAGFVAFYPAMMEACLVDGVAVEPQPGGFYGGWITPDVTGPFKGGPGTERW